MDELNGAGKHIAIIGGIASVVALLLVMKGGSSSGGKTTVVQPAVDPSGDALQLAQVNASRDAFGVLVQGVTGLEAIGVSAARDIHLAEIGQATQTTLAQYQTVRDTTIAQTQANADVAKANAVADAQITVGKADARAQSNSSLFGMITNATAAVAALFGL